MNTDETDIIGVINLNQYGIVSEKKEIDIGKLQAIIDNYKGKRDALLMIVHDIRAEYGDVKNSENHAYKTMVNYYGDPTLSLFDSKDDILLEFREKIDDNSDFKENGGCGLIFI